MLLTACSLAQIAGDLRAEQRDLVAYVHEACDRVEAIDPDLQALLPEPGQRERLLREAHDLAARYPDRFDRPALYGVLVGIKDIFNVAGFPTGAGSRLPPELFAGPEASSVTRLKQAGALVLGKTVTTEFAYFEPGPTRNPHNLAHTPGGSSSGSAAAVAAGYCPLALGTQTVGSVIRPAAFCGIVGFKPSFGRIAIDGVVPFSRSVDHIGMFAQDVAGMRLAAAVLCDGWHESFSSDTRLPVLGLPDGPYLAQASPQALDALDRQIAQLTKQGYVVRHVRAFEDFEAIRRRHTRLISAEVAEVHQSWFPQYEQLYRPRTAAIIRDGQQVGSQELLAARSGRLAVRRQLEALMAQAGIDLWICPAATGPAPHGLDSTGDPVMNLPWTHTGMPALTLPAGYVEGLPVGLQCVAAFGADEQLLAWAEGIEQALQPLTIAV